MTLPTTFMIDAPGDAARAAELRHIKWLATLLLATTFALFIVARAFVHVHPTLGFVAAFAEAATIGGLADWYAVAVQAAPGIADPAHRVAERFLARPVLGVSKLSERRSDGVIASNHER